MPDHVQVCQPVFWPSHQGGVSIPLAVLGTVSGGVLMRRRALGVGGASKLCAAAILFSLCCAFPLILMGCPTQTVDGVFPPR